MTTIGVDDPAILAAQRAHKHAKRVLFFCRTDAALPLLAQWEAKVRTVLGEALDIEQERKELPWLR